MQRGPRSRSLPISVPRSAKSPDVPILFGAAGSAVILTMGIGFLASPDLAIDVIVSAAEVTSSLIQWMEYLAIVLVFALVCAGMLLFMNGRDGASELARRPASLSSAGVDPVPDSTHAIVRLPARRSDP
jgi:hypothetical protein